MTAHLDLEYLRPVPTNKPLRIEGRLLRFERRKYWTEGQIVNSQGSVLAKCNGLFIQVTNIQE
jgi:acyl-coenzyme A thioesterase PaaI-like protein